MTASWLVQMGWKDVYVVKNALACGPLHKGPAPLEVPGLQNIRADTVTPTALARMLRAPGTVVVDFDSSLRYREGHVPGAWLAIRAHLAGDLEALPHADTLVFTSTDGVLATLAAADALALTDTPVKVLAGGTDAWRRARLPIETGMTHLANTTEDVWYRPYDRTSNQEEAMKDYLRWEIDLLEKIQRDDDVRFAIPARP
jgi:3-mercaptopyruvate sulfurtransferase SseA